MGLSKYKFNPGEKLPAENASSIDPQNVLAQAAGYLTGGSGHSAIGVFQSLGAGVNNGKVKASIDGTIYDNVPVDLLPQSDIAVGGTGSVYGLYTHTCGQSFTLDKEAFVETIKFHADRSSSGNWNLQAILYAANSDGTPTGSPITSASYSTSNYPYASGELTLTVNQTLPAGKYHLHFPQAYQSYEWYSLIKYNTSSYAGGSAFYDGVAQAGKNLYMTVDVNSTLTLSGVAGSLQGALRTATGKNILAIYDTDHFKITSATVGRSSSVLKLMTPSAGTDLSGAGATPYLDMAANATETPGVGDEFLLARLDENNLLPTEIVNQAELFSVKAGDAPVLSANTERSTNATSYTKLKEITINKAGTYRVYFGLRRNSSSNTAYGKIYKNGIALGTQRTSTSSTVAYYSEDFNFAAGDKVQLYAYIDSASYTALVSNFQLRALLSPVLVGTVNTD